MKVNNVYVCPTNKTLYYKKQGEDLTNEFTQITLSGNSITKVTQNHTNISQGGDLAIVQAALQPPAPNPLQPQLIEKDNPGRTMKRTKRSVSITPPTGVTDIPISNTAPTSAYFNTLPTNDVMSIVNYQLKFYKPGNYSFQVMAHIETTQSCKVSVYLVAYEGITRKVLGTTTITVNGIQDLNMQFNASIDINQLISIEAQSDIEGVAKISLNTDVEGNITGPQTSVTVSAGGNISVI